MAKLDEITAFLDQELKLEEIPDYPGAHNGLQLESRGEVNRVATAVDASLPVIRKVVENGADLLIVHHGLFWQGVRKLTGPHYKKLKIAMDADLAIYSAHIPLDVHPTRGNNVLLADAIGLQSRGAFMDWKGIQLGISGQFSGTLGELRGAVCKAVNGSALLRGKEESEPGRVGVITGGAGSEVEKVVSDGIDTFITGEGPHWSHPLAEELGLNVIYAGHYATETFGVKSLGRVISGKFGTSDVFLDHPTGL